MSCKYDDADHKGDQANEWSIEQGYRSAYRKRDPELQSQAFGSLRHSISNSA